jgi:AraC family transcriptional regulator
MKEKLLDLNLSVSQAFAACGVDYSGYYAKLFRQQTGETPRQYRNHHR